MNKERFVKFVEEELLIKYKNNIGLNSIRLKERWFLKYGYGEYFYFMFSATKFLIPPCSLGERIHCIINDVSIRPTCFCCGAELKFKNFVGGYRVSCGKHDCNLYAKANYIDETGLTPNQRSGIGISKSVLRIMPDGRTFSQHASEKTMHTKRNTFLENGLSVLQDSARKSAKTKMTTFLPNGLTIAQDAAIRSAKTMENIITGSLGENIREFRIRKMLGTKSIVGDDGIDVHERAFLNGAGRNCSTIYHESGLYCQGTYEKEFLDMATSIGLVELVERGPRINYEWFDNTVHQYRSDFLLNGKIFEMKSVWSYDNAGKDLAKREKTNLKIFAAVNKGYCFVLVYNKTLYRLITKETFDNFNIAKDSLLEDLSKFSEFSESVLYKFAMEDKMNYEIEIKPYVASFDVDPQKGFTPFCPQELPVPGADNINMLFELAENAGLSSLRVASKDWHHPHAIHIATNENKQFSPISGNYPDMDIYWNKHCIAGTIGAEFLNGLPSPMEYDFISYKGMEKDEHPYSACYRDLGKKKTTGVIEFLKINNIEDIIVGGLAMDYCVKDTCLDLLNAGFNVYLNIASSRGITEETTLSAIAEMADEGVVVCGDYTYVKQAIISGHERNF